MTPDLYWDRLFEVIERTLSPHRKPSAPPSKRISKRKPKARTKRKVSRRVVPKAKKAKEQKVAQVVAAPRWGGVSRARFWRPV